MLDAISRSARRSTSAATTRRSAASGCGRSLCPEPAGESNVLELGGRGVFVCISPWNFPARHLRRPDRPPALVAGNAVVAKPAEQTPLVAFRAVQLMHGAGVPHEVLHLVLGDGSPWGAP